MVGIALVQVAATLVADVVDDVLERLAVHVAAELVAGEAEGTIDEAGSRSGDVRRDEAVGRGP